MSNGLSLEAEVEQILAQNFGNEVFHPGLIRINHWIQKYNLYPKQSKIITICGTNGKGETTHCLGHLLKINKIKYCQWTSPHILSICERFVADGEAIKLSDLATFIKKWVSCLADNPEHPLSYYEFLFVVFLDWSKGLAPEKILLEVGLGGRLDAVNALNADLVLLASISRDHQEFLGKRYQQILQEKLGVLRQNGNLISNLELKYLRQLTGTIAKAKNCNWQELYPQIGDSDFSQMNRLLAYAAFAFYYPQTCLKDELEKFSYGNRMQIQLGKCQFTLIGSHNPDGMRKLVQFLDRHHYNNYDGLLLSFSKRCEKDVVSMANSVANLATRIWISSFEHSKAVELIQLKQTLTLNKKGDFEFIEDYKTIIQKLSASPNKVLVTGSYYFVGTVYSYIQSLGPR